MNSFLSIFSDSKSTVSRLVCAGLLVATVGFAPTNATVFAQDNTSTFSRNAPKEDFSDLWISLDFAGGNAIEYVDAIRRAAQNANIVVMPNAKMIDIPPVQLRAVTLASALDFLDGQESTVEGVSYRLVSDRIESGTLPLSVAERQREGVSANHTLPIYVVNVMVDTGPRNFRRSKPKSAQVWAVESLIGTLSADDLLAAIDVALPLVKEGEANIEVRFHEETGILIASGESAALEMINQVIEQLGQTVRTRNAKESEASELDEARKDLSVRYSQLLSERAANEKYRNQAQSELEQLREIINTIRTELADRDQRIQQSKEEIFHLREELARKKDKE